MENSTTPPGRWLSRRSFITAIACAASVSGLLFISILLRDTGYEHTVATSLLHQAAETFETSKQFTPLRPTAPYESDQFCQAHPDPGNIVVVIKTGATEVYDKVPGQLASSLRCVAHPLIFSDLEQRLGVHHVHDVLSKVDPEEIEHNPEFEIYKLQQEYAASGRQGDLQKLRELPIATEDWRTEGKTAAWGLDKYKFLHMIERSWELAPEKDWYLFVEADTYVSWPNLLLWLRMLDPKEKSYFGNAIRMYEHPETLYFGHGGAGVLLSGSAVRDFAKTHRGLANRWDHRIAKMWFGDYILAAALHEDIHLDITDALPSMTENDPASMTFDDKVFCLPVLTLHHISPQLLSRLTQYERMLNNFIMLYRDVYRVAFPGGLPSGRNDWDNLIEDEYLSLEILPNSAGNSTQPDLIDPHGSYKACELSCNTIEHCLQFTYVSTMAIESQRQHDAEGECHLSSAFKLGTARQPEVDSDGKGKYWSSGWMRDRIAKWVEQHEDCRVDPRDWPR